MPKFLEKQLKKEYGEKSDIPYKIMNSKGYMKGNKETKKGERAEEKHEAKSHAIKKMMNRSKDEKEKVHNRKEEEREY